MLPRTLAMGPRPIRVLVVDDQSMLRAAFRSLLSTDPRFEVVGDCGGGSAAVRRVAELRPDVVLLDLPQSGSSGLEALGPLRDAHPEVRLLLLAQFDCAACADQALRGGADGWLSKDSDPADLMSALESVHAGRALGGPWAGSAPQREQRLDALTPRELEVFRLLALGRSNKDVARELAISLGTAKKHRENLQRKLECHSSAELARLAIREGLVES